MTSNCQVSSELFNPNRRVLPGTRKNNLKLNPQAFQILILVTKMREIYAPCELQWMNGTENIPETDKKSGPHNEMIRTLTFSLSSQLPSNHRELWMNECKDSYPQFPFFMQFHTDCFIVMLWQCVSILTSTSNSTTVTQYTAKEKDSGFLSASGQPRLLVPLTLEISLFFHHSFSFPSAAFGTLSTESTPHFPKDIRCDIYVFPRAYISLRDLFFLLIVNISR